MSTPTQAHDLLEQLKEIEVRVFGQPRDDAELRQMLEALTEIVPAMRFVNRLVAALPWRAPPPVAMESARVRKTAALMWWRLAELSAAAQKSVSRIDHAKLRERLDYCRHDVTLSTVLGVAGARDFDRAVEVAVRAAYASGEIDIDRAEGALVRSSLEFPQEAFGIGSFMRLRTLATKPWGRRRPPFPHWVESVAVTLVRLLDKETPGQLAPGHYTNWTSPTLKASLDWLLTLGVFNAETLISPKTIYGWFKASGHVAASRQIS